MSTILPAEVQALAAATSTPAETAETIYLAFLERTLPLAVDREKVPA